jgi:hypothetical protein
MENVMALPTNPFALVFTNKAERLQDFENKMIN